MQILRTPPYPLSVTYTVPDASADYIIVIENVAELTEIEELSTKTVMALKAYAKKNNIELFDVNTKLEILEILASWIPPVDKEERVEEASKTEILINKVALYSQRNLHMDNLGALKVGYNIVSKEASEKWLTHRLVRVASPEELAAYYGK